MSRREKPATTAPAVPETAATAPVANKPLRVFRARGVSCAVFENHATVEGRPVTFLKAELRRVFRDGEEFKTTHSLSVNDVPVARLLLEEAFAFMLEAGQGRDGAAGEPATETECRG